MSSDTISQIALIEADQRRATCLRFARSRHRTRVTPAYVKYVVWRLSAVQWDMAGCRQPARLLLKTSG